jgi:hypothetical protein
MPQLKRSALIAALLLAPVVGQAQDMADYDYENLVFSGVGAHLMEVFPARTDPALGLNLRVDLGLLGPNVRISPGLTFWSSQLRASEVQRMESRIEDACNRGGVPCPGIELGDVDVSDFSVQVDAHYLWTTDYFVEPYAGLGVSLHLLNGSGQFVDDTFIEELLDAVAPGLDLVGGLEFPVAGNLRVLGETRAVLTGNMRYISLSLGGAWRLPAEYQRPVVPPPPASPLTTGGR